MSEAPGGLIGRKGEPQCLEGIPAVGPGLNVGLNRSREFGEFEPERIAAERPLGERGSATARAAVLQRSLDRGRAVRVLLDQAARAGDFEGGPNVLEVYIGHLRSKLEQRGEKRLLQTVRGAGYVLRAAD